MRYIAKHEIKTVLGNPSLKPLKKYVIAQLAAKPDALHPSYDGLNSVIKTRLMEQLIKEQHGLCCYCMQRLEDNRFHIEHLAPQSSYKNEEVHYYNLFLSCGSNKEKKIHCGHQKGDIPIPKIISLLNPKSGERCQDYFKFNLQGEILPRQGFEDMSSNHANFQKLNALSKQLVGVIEVLNLNCKALVDARKGLIDMIMMLPDDVGRLTHALTGFSTPDGNNYLESLCEVAIYFLNFKLAKAA